MNPGSIQVNKKNGTDFPPIIVSVDGGPFVYCHDVSNPLFGVRYDDHADESKGPSVWVETELTMQLTIHPNSEPK